MSHRPDGGLQPYYGVYPAVVTDSVPDDLGRIEVELPWAGTNPTADAGQEGETEDPVRMRATLLSPWASHDQGLVTVPEVGSQVVVAFEAGNVRRPYVVGACWNGVEKIPHKGLNPSGDSRPASENRRVLRTKGGDFIELDDGVDGTKITISTRDEHTLVLDVGQDQVVLKHKSGHHVTLHSDGRIEIQANSTVDVTASAVNVNAAVSTFNGDIICNNLTARIAVISPMYTPGVGNVW